MVKESTKDKNAQPKTQQQPMQPGMMMWDAGIMYFSDGFDSQTTKPVIQAIIEKNLMPNSSRPKELTLVIHLEVKFTLHLH